MKLHTSLLFMFLFIFSHGQKIVLKNKIKRNVIHENEYVGITLKGEENHFKEWKNICRRCTDSTISDHIWKVDSISKENITFSQLYKEDSCYKFDTIDYMTYLRKEKYYKNWIIHEYFDSPDGDYLKSKYILKFPLRRLVRTIPIDSISSFTFPDNYSCRPWNLMTPLASLVFIVSAPFVAKAEDKFYWDLFLFTEAAGFYQGIVYYRAIDKNRVKTYSTNQWKMKIKN